MSDLIVEQLRMISVQAEGDVRGRKLLTTGGWIMSGAVLVYNAWDTVAGFFVRVLGR